MPGIIKRRVVQGGVDTSVESAIDTGLTSDGKTGWQITRFTAIWENGQTAPAADYALSARIQSESGVFHEAQDEVMASCKWALQNTAGVAVAVPLEPIKEGFVIGAERVTVQPAIYLSVISSASAQANTVIFVIEYEIIKLSDLEVLKLLYGGA